MKKYTRVWITVLAVMLVLSTPATALAQAPGPHLPPPPEWPIIGPVLRWLGFESQAEPTPTFDPNRPEYRISTVAEGQALWEELEPNTPVRIIVSQEAVNALIQERLQDVRELSSAGVTFEAGAVTLAATVERAALEREGIQLPFFLKARELSGQVTVAFGATNCSPTLTVKRVRIGRFSLPLRGMVQDSLNESLTQEWMPEICIERFFMLPGEFAVEGYRR